MSLIFRLYFMMDYGKLIFQSIQVHETAISKKVKQLVPITEKLQLKIYLRALVIRLFVTWWIFHFYWNVNICRCLQKFKNSTMTDTLSSKTVVPEFHHSFFKTEKSMMWTILHCCQLFFSCWRQKKLTLEKNQLN